MTAYVIGQITVKDPAKWEKYRSKVPTTLAPWGAELVLRGGRGGFPACQNHGRPSHARGSEGSSQTHSAA
ncbi:DUF1330 domain-containing protein [Marinobacter sp. 71-i]|uniref:DUF1330 domain-containing protein n=1 Tax=Marinobacter iranensis TaxID=2962607 RepID=A0ABT5YFP2_9GAMM|nr:DUF1330 domain-containing protein [Marinobacter iranensis]MDF0752412.1 DUF1330 domain-containing protein [Marinobacter iranensis]